MFVEELHRDYLTCRRTSLRPGRKTQIRVESSSSLHADAEVSHTATATATDTANIPLPYRTDIPSTRATIPFSISHLYSNATYASLVFYRIPYPHKCQEVEQFPLLQGQEGKEGSLRAPQAQTTSKLSARAHIAHTHTPCHPALSLSPILFIFSLPRPSSRKREDSDEQLSPAVLGPFLLICPPRRGGAREGRVTGRRCRRSSRRSWS